MAKSLLEPRVQHPAGMLSSVLAPLEPLSSLERSSSDIPISTSLDKRDMLDSADSTTHLLSRRALRTNVIPLSYNLSGAKPGVVVGATLGAVAGFILLCWLIWLLTSAQGTGIIEGSDVAESVHVTRRSDARSRRSRRTRTHRSEMSERSTPPRRRERILVEETVRRERSRAPPEPPEPEPMPISPEREREIHEVEVEEERRVDGDDVVEVIEEQSDITPEPPRRKKSGYRTVDPELYGGGNYEQREVHDSDHRRRRH